MGEGGEATAAQIPRLLGPDLVGVPRAARPSLGPRKEEEKRGVVQDLVSEGERKRSQNSLRVVIKRSVGEIETLSLTLDGDPLVFGP